MIAAEQSLNQLQQVFYQSIIPVPINAVQGHIETIRQALQRYEALQTKADEAATPDNVTPFPQKEVRDEPGDS